MDKLRKTVGMPNIAESILRKKKKSFCGFHCIKINNLGVRFGEQIVLKDVNLHIHCGSLNAIIGKNGAGKSTLVRAILKDVPTEGTIEYRDTKNGKMKDLKIGYVPQSINIRILIHWSRHQRIYNNHFSPCFFCYSCWNLFTKLLFC